MLLTKSMLLIFLHVGDIPIGQQHHKLVYYDQAILMFFVLNDVIYVKFKMLTLNFFLIWPRN